MGSPGPGGKGPGAYYGEHIINPYMGMGRTGFHAAQMGANVKPLRASHFECQYCGRSYLKRRDKACGGCGSHKYKVVYA